MKTQSVHTIRYTTGDDEIERYNIRKPMPSFTNGLTQRIWKRITAVPVAVKITGAE